ncbi:uncharacterized protein FIESC28_10079 [Fusarium coffeatum]|uniref:RING-type domain-containing protein n=1 Tax=Fusarium coffeatum TaxID=231269 RepID=A0A366QVI8_9HYPO|nr:uncharacterized protein FIESC28_10079 [Fusarium coffeatum]RBR08899.1 hypothetical protein FIESC28_10079 [Fusarium coffeatum]
MSSTLDYWPPIQEAIATNNDPSQPNSTAKVQCPICMDEIAVTSFPPVAPREGDNPGIDPTQGEILLCGHVLCQACRTHHNAHNCPMCRADLGCTDCGKSSKVATIPKEGPPSTIPDIAKGDDGARCADCNAKRWFNELIEQGEWPNNLADLEPGFVPLFYHVVDKLEAEKTSVTKDTITGTFSNIVRAEFTSMIGKRAEAIYNRSVTTGNRWFQNTPARMMKNRTAVPEAGDEALRRRMAHRQQLFQSLTDSYDEELQAKYVGPITLEEAEIESHSHLMISTLEREGRRSPSVIQDILRRRRSENGPAEIPARAPAPLSERDRDAAGRQQMAHDFAQMIRMQLSGPGFNPGPPRFAMNGMPPNGAPQADMQQDDSADIADMPLDNAMDTGENELPGLIDRINLEDGSIVEYHSDGDGGIVEYHFHFMDLLNRDSEAEYEGRD